MVWILQAWQGQVQGVKVWGVGVGLGKVGCERCRCGVWGWGLARLAVQGPHPLLGEKKGERGRRKPPGRWSNVSGKRARCRFVFCLPRALLPVCALERPRQLEMAKAACWW
eukprot:359636-Chlamydomonas_euryale.AAC.1